MFAGVKIGKKLAVAGAGDMGNGRAILLSNGPTYIIMAADICGPAGIAEIFGEVGFQCMGQAKTRNAP